jgi:hypothetical protein
VVLVIRPGLWRIRCDEPGCDVAEQHESQHMLMSYAEAEGWQLGVKLNGERARRGGKDYCPPHRKGTP